MFPCLGPVFPRVFRCFLQGLHVSIHGHRGWQRSAEEDLEEESDGEGALVPLLGVKPWEGRMIAGADGRMMGREKLEVWDPAETWLLQTYGN